MLYAVASARHRRRASVYSGSMRLGARSGSRSPRACRAIIAAGFGGGTALFIPVIGYLLRTRATARPFSGPASSRARSSSVVAQLLRLPPEVPQAVAKSSAVASRRTTSTSPLLEMLRTPHFYACDGTFLMMATGGLPGDGAGRTGGCQGHQRLGAAADDDAQPDCERRASRVSWGWISDRLGRENTMVIAFLPQAVCLLLVLTVGRSPGRVVHRHPGAGLHTGAKSSRSSRQSRATTSARATPPRTTRGSTPPKGSRRSSAATSRRSSTNASGRGRRASTAARRSR